MKPHLSWQGQSGLSAIHVLGIVALAGILYLIFFVESDKERNDRLEHDAQTARMSKLMALVREHYSGEAVSAGTFGKWKIVSIEDGANNPFSKSINSISVRLAVDDRIHSEIRQLSKDGQFRAASNGCPPRISPIYTIMTNNDNLTLQVEFQGAVFIDVNCMQWAGTVS